MQANGTLYLVSTPIGNLEDITLRAIRTLRECSVIAAEDTRRARQLLKAHGIDRPLLSCHKFNEAKRTSQFLNQLENGDTLALVSDAGTPGISDPGERIVRATLESGLRVESVPGPCALTAALPASGLPATELMVRFGAHWLLRTDPELVLYGRYCVSRRLEEERYEFAFENIKDAMSDLCR